MKRITCLAAAMLAAALPLAARAENPDACSLISLDEINTFAGGLATKISPRKSGNPSECAWEDNRRAAVFVLRIREVQFAAENELGYDRENLEKIYRQRAKFVKPPIGDGEQSFWLLANKTVMFRKAKRVVSVTFANEKNANENDTIAAARLVESHIK